MKHKKTNGFYLSTFLFLTISFLFVTSTKAATYYVDQNHPNASDDNPGTEELPWKTLIYGAAQLRAGDTLLVKNGTYATQPISPPEWIPGIRIVNSGTENNPIIVKAYPGHHPIIDGKTAEGYYTFGGHQVSHVIIDGFTVNYGVIIFNESSNIKIQNCELIYGYTKRVDLSYTNMIELRYTNFVTINNNIIHGNKFSAPKKGQNAAAIILHWANDTIIENNFFYDNIIDYRDKLGSETTGYRNIFRKNIVENSGGIYFGDYERTSTDDRVQQNIFINVRRPEVNSAVTISSGNIGLVVANNVFYDDSGSGVSAIYYPNGGAGMNTNPNHQIYNNIFCGYKSPVTNNSGDDWPPNIYIDYNDYYNFVGFMKEWYYLTFDQFKAQVGENNNVILNKDPLFVNTSNRDFRFQSGSPCINAGIDRQDYDNDGDTTERINMGSYITGNECIGLLENCQIQPDTTPPAAPRNLKVL